MFHWLHHTDDLCLTPALCFYSDYSLFTKFDTLAVSCYLSLRLFLINYVLGCPLLGFHVICLSSTYFQHILCFYDIMSLRSLVFFTIADSQWNSWTFKGCCQSYVWSVWGCYPWSVVIWFKVNPLHDHFAQTSVGSLFGLFWELTMFFIWAGSSLILGIYWLGQGMRGDSFLGWSGLEILKLYESCAFIDFFADLSCYFTESFLNPYFSLSRLLCWYAKLINLCFFLQKEQVKRLHLLLTVKDSAANIPKNLEARRRLEFFTNSLFMDMPPAKPVSEMMPFWYFAAVT